jgi:hypothetical protein
MRGYFHFCFDPEVQSTHAPNIFEADVHPFGSVHDRACELYQQLIGITRVSKDAEKEGLNLCEKVYGKDHASAHHLDHYLKPRYLKSVADGKYVLAYPDGIPGGWCRHRKVHLVGHSQGA